MRDNFFHTHVHSRYSWLDGMGKVEDLVIRAKEHGQPALGLTDHGVMSGTVSLYKSCKEHGLLPFPGIEGYCVQRLEDRDAKRWHVGLLALDYTGYQGLVRLNTKAFDSDHFHRKPRFSYAELKAFGDQHGEHVALLTGCWFGMATQLAVVESRLALGVIRDMAEHFPNTYVELQNHNINHTDDGDAPYTGFDITDWEVCNALYDIANELGLPVIITQDSHYCCPAWAPVWMWDMSFKPLGDIRVGDEVVGWEDGKNRRFEKAVVTDIHRRTARVVRITMASGRVIVCTPGHLWADGRAWRYVHYRDKQEWTRARPGKHLVNLVVPPRKLNKAQALEASWLGGIYDGEGSRQGIAQSRIANPDVCKRIENALNTLGMEFTEQDNGTGTSLFRLLGGRQAWTDFINQAMPVKREWFQQQALGMAKAMEYDEVVSVDDAGVEEVVSLTTTTGNYAPYGYASKNCDHEDKPVHEMMKRLGYHSSDDSEILFPGDSYHLADTKWMRKHYAGLKEAWRESQHAYDDLIDKWDLSLPALDTYSFNVPRIQEHPVAALRYRATKALEARGLTDDAYMDRMDYELDIIREMGFGNYFILVSQVVQWCEKRGILINARGSVNGSLVCYALGITQIDPLEWGISFNRFLHPTRKKPPDIDLDIERESRDRVIGYLERRYSVVHIGTYGRLTDAEDRGAVFQKYLGWKRREMGKEAFDRSEFARIEYLRELESIVPEDTAVLRKLADMEVFTGGGTHAAGYVLTTQEQPIEDYIPLMRVGGKHGNLVTQYDDDEVEDLGYVKFDALGLAALTTVGRCLELIGRDPRDGLGWIPLDDPDTMKTLREGRTDTGIFQFEGYSTAKGARLMKVKTTRDCVYCLALFRPAAMDSGNTDEYMLRRQRKQKVTYVHDTFKQHTKETYGVFVLQDQVLDVLREVGMDEADLNDMLKAVKASNINIRAAEDTFDRLEKTFLRLCRKRGMDKETRREAWRVIRGFSDYGFNKAHATSYGLLGYRMAYLKTHHTRAFMAALLETWSGDKKERRYLGEARRLGIKVHRVNVNLSGERWGLDANGDLRRGLTSVKGVGPKAAGELVKNQPFDSVDDIIERCDGSNGAVTGGKSWAKDGNLKGVLAALRDAGALDPVLEGEPHAG